jgi:hypothetical protein
MITTRGVFMMKKIAAVTGAVAAGALLFGGVASAQGPDSGYNGQAGLLNLNNTSLLHNVNAVVGLCDNDVNVIGVQVPIRHSLNGIGVPILSPGNHEASGDSPENCAAGGIADGGTSQGH